MQGKKTGALACGVLIALLAGAAPGDEIGAGSSSAGMRVFVDPETGELTAPPAGARDRQPPAALQGVPESGPDDADLVERVNPAGGYSVDLKRRFGGVARAVAGPARAADAAAAVDVECVAGEQPASR